MLTKDDEIWFRIDTIQPWKGTVRWVSAGNVGVEFESPLFPSRYELVAELRKQAEFSKA